MLTKHRITPKAARRKSEPGPPTLPAGVDIEQSLLKRRWENSEFAKVRPELRRLIDQCARGSITSMDFYSEMRKLWRFGGSRFQGLGYERSCKRANWQQVCKSLKDILNSRPRKTAKQLDLVVAEEIDRLAHCSPPNPARGVWLTEMLCHWFPKLYPLASEPVWSWLHDHGCRPESGLSEGRKYIYCAECLRRKRKAIGIEDLTELDKVISDWQVVTRGKG